MVLLGGFCFSLSSSASVNNKIEDKNSVAAVGKNKSQPDEILVKFKNSQELAVIKVPIGINLEIFLKEYGEKSGVEYVEPNYSYHASIISSDKDYKKQWYLEKIRAPLTWDRIRETPNIVIAVIDSGVQITHPDLAANIWVNKKEIPGNGFDDDNNGFIDDVNGWDFFNNVADPAPKFEKGFTEAGVMHGTIVAGIIAAVGDNGLGVAGITWKAQIMPLKVLDDKGEGRTIDVVRAIDYAINNKADIINFSFVGLDYSRGLYEAIKRAHDAGIIMVAAAGNEQSQGDGYDLADTPMYPACDDGEDNMVIGVAATDAIDQKTDFSSYGSRCVDITAPGISFYSTVVYAPMQKIYDHYLDQYYGGYWSGTSMATPVVAGVLSLIEGANPSIRAKEVQEIILATADDISRLNPNYPGQLGQGRVNAFNSVVLAVRQMIEKSVRIIFVPVLGNSLEIKEVEVNGGLIKKFTAENFRNSGSIASGDVDGDYKDEIVIGAGRGNSPQVRIYDAAGVLKKQFLAYDKNFRGGVKVALKDLNDDGKQEIITAPGPGTKPNVKIFDNQGRLETQFFAYSSAFLGGVNIAAGDVDGDGEIEIITGAGSGGGPQVRIFNSVGKNEGQFFAYAQAFRGGINVAVADLNGGAARHKEEIITAPVKNGGPQVRIFDNSGAVLGQFFAYDQKFHGGVSIAAGDVDGDGLAEIITGAGPGGGPHVRVFEANGKIIGSFYGYDASFTGGVNVGTAIIKN